MPSSARLCTPMLTSFGVTDLHKARADPDTTPDSISPSPPAVTAHAYDPTPASAYLSLDAVRAVCFLLHGPDPLGLKPFDSSRLMCRNLTKLQVQESAQHCVGCRVCCKP